jgi:hypothetical protein
MKNNLAGRSPAGESAPVGEGFSSCCGAKVVISGEARWYLCIACLKRCKLVSLRIV